MVTPCFAVLLTGDLIQSFFCAQTSVVGFWFFAIMLFTSMGVAYLRLQNVMAPSIVGILGGDEHADVLPIERNERGHGCRGVADTAGLCGPAVQGIQGEDLMANNGQKALEKILGRSFEKLNGKGRDTLRRKDAIRIISAEVRIDRKTGEIILKSLQDARLITIRGRTIKI